MTYKQDISIYRPLLPESAAQLQSLQDEYASIDSFVPVEDLHLTLLSGQTKKRLNIPTLQRVGDNTPKSSAESYDTEIVGARFDKRSLDLTRVALRLILNSEGSSHYFKEHEIFRTAVEKIDDTMLVRHFAGPHVTLGYLDTALGLTSVIDSAESLIGNYLSFGPIDSSVGRMHTPKNTIKHPNLVSTPMAIDAPVRILKLGAIPQGLLANMRPRA